MSGLTLDDSGDPSGNVMTITSSEVQYGPQGDPFVTIDDYQRMTQLTVDGGQNISTISVDSTGAPTIINPLGGAAILVCPTSRDLDGIAELTVNGDGVTGLTIDDQAGGHSSATSARWYTLGADGLTAGPAGQASPSSQVSFSGLASLSLNLSDKHATSLDIESVPAVTTIFAGTTASSIDVSSIEQNLDLIESTLHLNGGGDTTLNLYDQANRDETDFGGPDLYSFTWGSFTRTGYTYSPSVFTLDYSNLAGINLWAASELGGINRFAAKAANTIHIQGTGQQSSNGVTVGLTPLTINAGTSKDQVTVTLPAIDDASLASDGFATNKGIHLIGNLTINGKGSSLVIDDSGISNSGTPSGGYARGGGDQRDPLHDHRPDRQLRRQFHG